MNDPTAQLPPEIDFSSFDFTNLTNSFLPDEIKSKSIGEKYLVFFLEEDAYAIPTKQVSEVAPPLPITPLPNSPDWLLGIANLRNEIISVLNLPNLLKKSHLAISAKSKIIILHSPDAASHFAFTADRLSEIISLRKDEIQFYTNEESSPVSGKAIHLSNHLNLINPTDIISSLLQ